MTDEGEYFSLEELAAEENLTLDPSSCGNITEEYMLVRMHRNHHQIPGSDKNISKLNTNAMMIRTFKTCSFIMLFILAIIKIQINANTNRNPKIYKKCSFILLVVLAITWFAPARPVHHCCSS